jgi:hypothetical protein
MNMQSNIGELVRGGKEFDNKRRRLGLPSRFGRQGARESLDAKLSQKTEGSSISGTGLRTRPETVDNMEDKEVIFKMEKGPKQQIEVEGSAGNARQPPLPQPYHSRWMRMPQTAGGDTHNVRHLSRKRRQELATASNADGGTSCQGPTASRRASGPDNYNTDDWQAELLHDVNEDTFLKLDTMAWTSTTWQQRNAGYTAGRARDGTRCPAAGQAASSSC